jgi:signal transduction histidine kinase
MSTTRTKKERVYLKDVLNDIYKDYSPLLQMKGLTCDMDIGLIALIGDNELLRIAFSNLFSNAVKFTNKGGVKLSARSYDHTVSIHIRDTGIGISPQDQRKLFERFFKANPSAPGTGVGLALVKEIIDRHEGKIKIKSKIGKGTEFEILLPHYGGKGVDK